MCVVRLWNLTPFVSKYSYHQLMSQVQKLMLHNGWISIGFNVFISAKCNDYIWFETPIIFQWVPI